MTFLETKVALANQGVPVTVHIPGTNTAEGILRILPDEGMVKCVHKVPWGFFTREVDTDMNVFQLTHPTKKLGMRLQRFADEQSGVPGSVKNFASNKSLAGTTDGPVAARSLSLIAESALLDVTFASSQLRDEVFEVLLGLWEDLRPEPVLSPASLAKEASTVSSAQSTRSIVSRQRSKISTKCWSKVALSEPEVATAIKDLERGVLVTEWIESMLGLVIVTEQRVLRFELAAEAIIMEPVKPETGSFAAVFAGSRDDAPVVYRVDDLQRVGVHGKALGLSPRLAEKTDGKPGVRAKSLSLIFSQKSLDLTAQNEREAHRLARFFNMAREKTLVRVADADGEGNGEDADVAGGDGWAETLTSAGKSGGRQTRRPPAGARGGAAAAASAASGAGAGGIMSDDDDEGDDEIDPTCSWANMATPQADPEASLEAKLAKMKLRRAAGGGGVSTSAAGPAAAAAAAGTAPDPNPRRRSQPQLVGGTSNESA